MSLHSEYSHNILVHHGVKGMKWGRRKKDDDSTNKSEAIDKISKMTKTTMNVIDEYSKEENMSKLLKKVDTNALAARSIKIGEKIMDTVSKDTKVMDTKYASTKRINDKKDINVFDDLNNIISLSWDIVKSFKPSRNSLYDAYIDVGSKRYRL